MNRLQSVPFSPLTLRETLRSELDGLPDRELLERFTNYADQPAFEAILRRHGPMVWGVCRRMLNSTDTDDAFQATFLVLIRKAQSLRRADRLAPWLYGVAYRVARKARTQAARRANFLSEGSDMIPDRAVSTESPDWLPILDAELATLPAKYRDALVVCELQGASRQEAARILGLREGTLSSRLARGRALLRRRLLKHGTLLPAGGLSAILGTGGIGRATVPLVLLTTTAELAQVVSGATTGTVPVGVARLTDEVLKMMLLSKLRGIAGIAVVLLATTIGWVAADPGAQPTPPVATRSSLPPPHPLRELTPRLQASSAQIPPQPRNDAEALQGWWVLEKIQHTQAFNPNTDGDYTALIGHSMLYINGPVWWQIGTHNNLHRRIQPQIATLDEGKNPKWLDLKVWCPGWEYDPTPEKSIYRWDADDQFSIVVCTNNHRLRPAEFNPQDRETSLLALGMRRVRDYPPSAGAPELVGSWEQPLKQFRCLTNPSVPVTYSTTTLARVEIYDGLIFLGNLPSFTDHSDWIGGTYTVDTSRKPAGIDITLFNPINRDGVSQLYGSYETTRDGLKLVLGLTGKRAARPMDFNPPQDDAPHERMYFELSRAQQRPGESPPTAPQPKTK